MTKGGSSPRLRGTPEGDEPGWAARRFIPAPAGNTAISGARCSRRPVHPRACGEHSASRRQLHDQYRFIPAPAGNTSCQSSHASARSVHPRACGEHPSEATDTFEPIGSSPRLRGTRVGQRVAIGNVRFIPAPAGNTVNAMMVATSKSVHPRACGEHAQPRSSAVNAPGSSPRLRGTPLMRN